MKVAILSMQEVRNYGSFLQAWSLKHNIEALGHVCDFINITPGDQLGQYKQSRFDNVKKFVERVCGLDFYKRIYYFFRFRRRFDNEFFADLGVKVGNVNNNHYDVVVIGSDEVFNCAQKTWFGFSRQLFGEGLNADKVISYAASFGAADVKTLKELGVKDVVARLLKNFSSLSVRDENSYKTIKELIDVESLMHVDPVFIYDYDIHMKPVASFGDYMIVYTYPNRITDRAEINKICEYAHERNLKLISIGHYFSWCDKVIVPHPFEVLYLFKNANCIVTDTFHGSVFSIKYNKRFCTIVRGMNNNKLTYLLRQFGLSSRIAKTPNDIERILDEDIDYSSVNNQIAREKERSVEYLDEQLRS